MKLYKVDMRKLKNNPGDIAEEYIEKISGDMDYVFKNYLNKFTPTALSYLFLGSSPLYVAGDKDEMIFINYEKALRVVSDYMNKRTDRIEPIWIKEA